LQALVVDDSRAMRRILRAMLTRLGFEVIEAGNGREGLQQLEAAKPPPDVILVDWNMPEMNGFQFVQAVRAEDRLCSVPLMMVTTETEMDQVSAVLTAGANEYLMKPFGQEAIVDKLQILGLL
jgi:two-component system, chemotaxis family, chemotaxis protein CheY